MNKDKPTDKLLPLLRFPGFENDGEWKKDFLGNLATFMKGKGISKSDISPDGNQLCIRYGELYTDYKEIINTVVSKTNLPKKDLVLSKKNDVIIPSSGETQEDIATASCVLADGIALGGDINIIRTKINGVFLSYYLNNAKKGEIAKIAQGNAVVHLYSSQLEKLEVDIPKPDEQQKIADCLSSLDDLIRAEKKKLDIWEDHKKGLLQKLFPTEENTIPELRFPEFENEGEWVEKPISEILDYEQPTKYLVSNTNYINQGTPVLTANKGFILGYTDEKQGVYRDVPVIIFDDFTVDKKYVDFPFKVKSSAIKILKTKADDNIKFIFEAMTQIKFDADQHKRYYISTYQNLVVRVPNPKEQNVIADCLSSVDDAIKAQKEKIRALNNHKKGLVQRLFPNVNNTEA